MKRLLCAAVALVVLTGCGLSWQRGLELEEVVIEAQPDANGNAAVAVDVALVVGPGIADQLAKLPASEWFRRRAQFQRDYPDSLAVLSWELVPGQTTVGRPERGGVTDGYLFAGYASPGDHRLRLGLEERQLRVVLQATDFVIQGPAGEGR
ncbi:MAG: membrane lipoprotein lipid attachment site-containing protein [Magnetospirillum sp.]|nr:membrane lipoprotein lipid attachment site-containing protein [Magnetospirillum sp.]